jgi:hypothetical protein
MATFLDLAKQVAAESGTVTDGKLTTVTGQTGRLGNIVRWTNRAWRNIQTAHADWLWMRSTFAGSTVAGTRDYSGSDLGVATRFGDFVYTGGEEENRYSIYRTATGPADERPLVYRSYDHFYTHFMRGVQTEDYPRFFTIMPDGRLALHPIPNAVYTVRGPYRKDVQNLTADGDVPEMPGRYHDVIADLAMEFLATFDEAAMQFPLVKLRKIQGFSELERDQLPKITFGGTFA